MKAAGLALSLSIAGAVALIGNAPPPLRAQSAATTTVTGRVLADETGEPIANARVAAPSPNEIGTTVTLTDDGGRFTLALNEGATRIVASKPGFGRREIVAATAARPIEIRLVRGAVLSGRVVDEFGDAVQNARVVAYAIDPTPGTRLAPAVPPTPPPAPSPLVALVPPPPPPPPGPGGAAPVATAVADTDDRGEFRLASIPPGTYVAAALTADAPRWVEMGPTQFAMVSQSHRTYFPGTEAVDEAQRLVLQAGEDRPGIDVVTPGARSMVSQFAAFQPSPVVRAPAPRAGATATAVIRGRIVGTDGRNIPNAVVRLNVKDDFRQATFSRSDGDARYEFHDLPAGAYMLAAAKVGYGPVVRGAANVELGTLPGGATAVVVTIGEGETREGATITLSRLGSVAGRVLDERGDPLQGANVQLMQVRYEAGRRRLVSVSGTRPTDDLGRYRLFSVPPGQYVVTAAVGDVQSADLPGYARSFYPGTANPGQALFVSVALSQELTGIDLSLSRVRTARISGKMLDAAGQPTFGGSVTLLSSQRATSVTNVSIGARIRPNGEFEFANVAPGQYVIQAYKGRSNGWTEGEFGVIPVSVDGADVSDLVLQMSTGSAIHGHFTFTARDPSKRPAASAVELTATPVDFDRSPSNVASAALHDDWTFEMAGVNGPRRLQLVRAPAGWMLEDVLVHGISAVDRPLPFGRSDQSLDDVEVRLTDRISELAGTVTNDRGERATGAVVIAFATDRSRWYPGSRFLRSAAVGADGTFSLSGLPFGSYYVAVIPTVPDEGADAWQDTGFLESVLPRASTTTIRDAQKQTLDLRLR